jgi:hypothetical protein
MGGLRPLRNVTAKATAAIYFYSPISFHRFC